jgi:hypothetical protein
MNEIDNNDGVIVLYLFSATGLNSTIISTTANYHDKSIFVHHVPQCSNNRTFYEDVEYCPENHFAKILHDSSYGKEYYVSKTTRNHSLTDHTVKTKITKLCASSVKKKQHPRVAYDVNKKWRYI